MKLSRYDIIMQAAFAAWVFFRRWFPPEAIYFKIARVRPPHDVYVCVMHPKGDIAIRIGESDETEEKIKRAWNRLAKDWNSRAISDAEIEAVMQSSLLKDRWEPLKKTMRELGVLNDEKDRN